MLDAIKKHWFCLLLGGLIGYCIHFCPLFVGDANACQCKTCCVPCDCVEECVDGSCPCCPKVAGPCLPAPQED